MNNDPRIPLYLITGFLDSGKTTLLIDTLEMDYFNDGQRTVLLMCEDGEVEYNAQYLAERNCRLIPIEDQSQLNTAFLEEIDRRYQPERVLLEYNGMWPIQLLCLPIETFITTIVLSLGIAGPLLAAMDFVDSLAKVGTIVGSVDAILNGAEQDHGETPAEFQGRDIRLSHVSFGYHADKEVLHDVSLTIPAGTMTAFVGPSGSGKSTIAKLIAGFWDVTSGSITLGGQDLKRVPLKQLYDQVAFVSQDNYLFDESIRENIRMGRPAATDAEVEAVAKAAGCDAFIRSLEHGYDTVVGGGGAHLSGGERQRIAIARAMLKDAPIVVLDEATAYIDPENEAVVQQAVGKLVAGKTVLVIAHRLSTITGADQIVVVNGGRSQDVGTHGELLKNCPLYQEMWRAHMGAKEGEQA